MRIMRQANTPACLIFVVGCVFGEVVQKRSHAKVRPIKDRRSFLVLS
jgi:hypothetical protein